MNLQDIVQFLKGVGLGNLIVIVGLLLSLIQIAPIKIDPWSKLFKWVGKIINGSVMDELKGIKEDLANVHAELDNVKEREEEREANSTRYRILRFDDELRQHIDHSEEHFTQILADVDKYKKYCDAHKDGYVNSKADSAMENIRTTYDDVKKYNKFI